MDFLDKLGLEILRSDLKIIPFTHFNLPKTNSGSFLHELAHLLQFKRNEIGRWNTGKYIFYVKYKGYRNLKRETATEAIEYNLIRFFDKKNIYPYFKYNDIKKSHYSKIFKKKYNKRLLKKRSKFVREWLEENIDYVNKMKSIGTILINKKDLNKDIERIIGLALKSINNSQWVDFKVNDIEYAKKLLSSTCLEYKCQKDIISVLI